MPYYFSGTFCIAGGVAVPSQGARITHAELKIGGQSVRVYDETPSYIISGPLGLGVTFDSSHFANGTSLAVTVHAVDSLGHVFDGSGSAVVKNSVELAQHPEPLLLSEQGDLVRELIGPSYTPDLFGGYWGPGYFVDRMNGKNVVFVASHGTSFSFMAGEEFDDGDGFVFKTWVFPFGDDHFVVAHPMWRDSVGVEPYRVPQMGTGLPPFNSTGNPPINLAFLECCGAGGCQNFIRFCYPYQFSYGSWLQDQAFTGFVWSIFLSNYTEIARVAFTALADGYTLSRARDDIMAHSPAFRTVPAGNDPGGHQFTVDDMPIWGDDRMRLKTVYTADYSNPVGWFIPQGSSGGFSIQ